jgi:CheY-like chemotaxis protein/CHASE3 domain sensor protein
LAPRAIAGFLIAFAAVAVTAILSYASLQSTARSQASLTKTIEMLSQLQMVLSTLKDAETGQRGYLLTGRDSYLEPYTLAQGSLGGELKSLHALTDDNPEQRQRLATLEILAADKMQELGRTVALRRSGKADEALAVVGTDHGKNLMDGIRDIVAQMADAERRLIGERTAEWRTAATVSFAVTLGGSAILLALIAVAATLAARDFQTRQTQSWLRIGKIGLSEAMQGDQSLDKLGNSVLTFLAEYLGARVGAIFIAESGRFRRTGGFALPATGDSDSIRPGDGLTGEAVRANRVLHVREVPAGYLSVSSSLGRAEPSELLIAPVSMDGKVQAVVELGFFGSADATKQEFLNQVSETIAVAVRASKDRSRLEELLQETQTQTEELQTREEELRVNNEELEEQGNSLKESRAQLESQQAELEQINAQLEVQTQLLERQKDELSKSNTLLTAKTVDLQRANEYKSEFLANMSHELRTPLNSTLILAKLLADNKEGNLSDQQVKFAQTISSAGNDLLTLINDVLDLSRIEAGKIDVAPERVPIARAVESLRKIFQPAAEQKKLGLSLSVEPGAPESLETDPQRLGQILRNLLSNALKFTEKGEVSLRVFSPSAGLVAFAVRDTGVGIPENQQAVIFEAFRQADGSIHRKYGGTGLGLSISKDLARLLGGTIAVDSVVGEGSLFTLTLPLTYASVADSRSEPRAALVAVPSVAPLEPAAGGAAVAAAGGRGAGAAVGGRAALAVAGGRVAVAASGDFASPAAAGGRVSVGAAARAAASTVMPVTEDDRDQLLPGSKVILVIEDDVSFALILRDLANEMGYQCVVTHSASEGLAAAAKFHPSAILLDMNLPDHSGLGVLDQLKRDPRTRHIPVHVASVADYRREALELGAVGYALKPAKREELVEVLRLLEAKLAQGIRRVLIVEDDPRQRESIEHLLTNGDVQVTAVENAGDALTQLKSTTFDCVVMDFNLPDYSGYDLLEKMAQQEDVAFPPVIVYTGRALSVAEEQRLRRYSKSIIIKDARSPERLLDEVTLFLHQVESKLPPDRQQMLKTARNRETSLEGRRVLVVEDDVRNIFALSSVLEPKGATIEIARNGLEALDALTRSLQAPVKAIDLVLMDIMMPEMDGFTAMREIRRRAEWKKLPIIALTAKAMKDDQEKCLAAGANDYIAKPLDVEKLLSLVRVWMPR